MACLYHLLATAQGFGKIDSLCTRKWNFNHFPEPNEKYTIERTIMFSKEKKKKHVTLVTV